MADFPGSNNSQLDINGLFKKVYADKTENIIPDGKKVMNLIKFLPKNKAPGQDYNQAIILGLEHGVTYAHSDEGAFALNEAVAGSVKQASIKGFQLLLRSALSYESVFRSATTEAAFEQATKYIVMNMMDSIHKKLEVCLLYGQSGLGVVDAAPAPTTTTFKIVDAEFAPGIWAGSRGMKIDVYTSGGVAVAGAQGISIQKVDLDTKVVTLAAPLAVPLTATDVIYAHGSYAGGTNYKEMRGMYSIMNNTGLMFGIDAAQYELWEGTQYALPVTDVLSFAVIQQAITKGVEKGLEKDVTVLCNPGHWDDLLTEQAALRMYDSSYKTEVAENGARTIKFHSQNGMVEIVPSIYVKEGHAFVVCKEDWARIGSTEVTFKRPGQEDKYFRELEGFAGVELRAYTDQALLCIKPGRQVLITNLKVS